MSNKTITLISQVLVGLNMPLALHGVRAFGAAYQPLLDLREDLQMFGYQTAEEVEECLRRALEEKVRDR